jgi:hypothetical protein
MARDGYRRTSLQVARPSSGPTSVSGDGGCSILYGSVSRTPPDRLRRNPRLPELLPLSRGVLGSHGQRNALREVVQRQPGRRLAERIRADDERGVPGSKTVISRATGQVRHDGEQTRADVA